MILITYLIHSWWCVRFPYSNELHSYINKLCLTIYVIFFEKKLISLSKTCNRVSLWFRELVRLDIHATEWLIYAGSHISVCEDKVQKLQNACYNLNYKDTPILNLFSNPILLTLAMPINKKKKKKEN